MVLELPVVGVQRCCPVAGVPRNSGLVCGSMGVAAFFCLQEGGPMEEQGFV